MDVAVEIIADDHNLCGEAPTWDHRTGRLLWTDIPNRKVCTYAPETGRRSLLCDGCSVAGIALHADGGWVVAGSEGLHILAPDGSLRTVLATHEGAALNFNDILADPAGRIYAGTYYWRDGVMVQHGRLYLVDTDGSVRVVADGVHLSNGLALSLDHRTLYYADSAARTIHAYDVSPADGTLANRCVFVRLPDDGGVPDGLTIDAEGFVWCAQWFDGQVVRYDPDGQPQRRIAMPVKQVSSVAFGRQDLSDLFVTSAAGYVPTTLDPPGFDRNAPMGGPLYRIGLDVAGRCGHLARIAPPAH